MVFGENPRLCVELILRVLGPRFKIRMITGKEFPLVRNKKEILVFGHSSLADEGLKNILSLLQNSDFPIMAAGRAEKKLIEKIKEIAEKLPEKSVVVLDSDKTNISALKGRISAKVIGYGLQSGADLLATDLNKTADEVNFKINLNGDMIPFWLSYADFFDGEDGLSNALSAIAVGVARGLNLVEISQTIQEKRNKSVTKRL